MGPVNLATTMPYHASQMYASNVTTLLKEFLKDGQLEIDMENDVVEGCLVCKGGEIVHPRVRELVGLAPLEKPAEKPASQSDEGGAS
jgi:NAD(P) transhydrogenase subunit alpha